MRKFKPATRGVILLTRITSLKINMRGKPLLRPYCILSTGHPEIRARCLVVVGREQGPWECLDLEYNFDALVQEGHPYPWLWFTMVKKKEIAEYEVEFKMKK